MPLSPDRWRELSPYLDEALEIAVDQQAAWLATIRDRDPGLAADLQMLLAEQQAIHNTTTARRDHDDPDAGSSEERRHPLNSAA